MKKIAILSFFVLLATTNVVLAQGNIHVPGEGGVFTANRLAGMKGDTSAGYAEEYDIGNNPWMMNLYSDMRRKFARMGEEVDVNLDDIEGSIYLDESFQLGALYQNGVVFKRIYMRYNGYNDEVELKVDLKSDRNWAMLKNVEYSCSINGDKFLYMQYVDGRGGTAEGYLTPMVQGSEYVLYQKRIKDFKDGKAAKTSLDKGFPNRFLDKTEYYVSVNGGKPEYIKTKKSEVLSVFSEEDQKKIKQFIRDKQINLGDNLGLTNLFAYANTL